MSDADLLDLHRVGSAGLLPDLTVLIEVSPDLVAARLAKRDGDGADRIGGRDAAYHARVAAAFATLATREPDRFAPINGDGEPAAVHRAVLGAVLGAVPGMAG